MADSTDPGPGDAPALFGRRDAVFRPWPVGDKEPANIADFVRRVKAQGGEFRTLTEERLRKEIAERQTQREAQGGEADGSDGDEEDADGAEAANDDEADGKLAGRTKGIEAMMAKREEVLRTLESALQHGLIVVDFVSLLLSKDRPTQALQTLSPLLREKIGIGTLSAGRIANAAQVAKALQTRHSGRGLGLDGGRGPGVSAGPLLDETTRFNAQRVLDHKIECVGWQLLAMDRAAELLAAGRRRLHAELRREQTYWAEVVGVRDRGWGLSRMPGHRRVLRVKFGFTEAAPDLRAAGFAPLRRVRHGHVTLDMAALGGPAAVVVTLRRTVDLAGGEQQQQQKSARIVLGRSTPSPCLPASASLEQRLYEARNTIYARELWRELNREARLLVAHGVALRGPHIVFAAGAHSEATIALEPLQTAGASADAASADQTDPELDALAEATASSLHLLLAHGHRQHYRQRSVPAQANDTGAPPPPYFLLRAVLANRKYEKAVEHLARFLADLCALLHAVGHTAARFTLFERPLAAAVPPATSGGAAAAAANSRQPAASEAVCIAYLSPREFTFELVLAADTRLSIRSRTTIVPLRTQYLVQLPPPSPLLQEAFPPADNYATLRDVVEYVAGAVAHVLAADARAAAAAHEAAAAGGVAGIVWSTTIDGMAVQRKHDPRWAVRFAVTSIDAGPRAAEATDHSIVWGQGGEDADADDGVDTLDRPEDHPLGVYDDDSPLHRFRPPAVRLFASWPDAVPEAAVHRRWTWTATSRPADEDGTTLQAIVQGCISGALQPAA